MRSPVAELLRDLAAVLSAHQARWYVFGARAAILHGSARLTADVDVTVGLPDAAAYPALITALESHGFELRTSAPTFVERTRVIPVVHSRTKLPLDLVLAGSGIEDRFFARARTHQIDDVSVPVASAEDVVLMKVLAGRPKDLDDVVAVVAARAADLDTRYIQRTLRELEEALTRDDLLPVFNDAVARSKER